MRRILLNSETFFDAKHKVWRGPKEAEVCSPDASIGRAMLEAMQNDPEHISQICDHNGRQYTNREIATMSIRVAQRFDEMGIEQEDVIGVCGADTDYLAPLLTGALLCGTTISTMHTSLDQENITRILNVTKPKLMFCDGCSYNAVKSALSEVGLFIPIYTMNDHREGIKQIEELVAPTGIEQAFQVKPLKLGSKQAAFILCSSGTTGPPKGVCLSHESLLYLKISNIITKEIFLRCTTIFWILGLQCVLHGIICCSTRIIADKPYTPEYILDLVDKYKVTVLYTSPLQMASIVNLPKFKPTNLDFLKVYISTGSPVSQTMIQKVQEHAKNCQIIVGYGLTEIGAGCSVGHPVYPGACGQLMQNMMVKIIDESGEHLGVSEKGEILIKPPFKWSGYYKNPEATLEIYDEDGWIHSGDIGYFDKEGNLYIVGRTKEIFKHNNFHISPAEIEELITQLPGVIEACVCGVVDSIFTCLPAAAIIRTEDSTLTEDEVKSYIAERLIYFKHLNGGVYFVDSLPKTPSGKHIRRKVTDIVQALRVQRECANTGRSL